MGMSMEKKIRKEFLDACFKVAESIATLSHDQETQIGAVLFENANKSIIAVSFNGHVRGADIEKVPTTRPDKYEYMIHAEQNLITNCARLGIKMSDCSVVVGKTPCRICTRLLYQAGIRTVYAKAFYTDFGEVQSMIDINIESYIDLDLDCVVIKFN
jgi:dCMP deaminase